MTNACQGAIGIEPIGATVCALVVMCAFPGPAAGDELPGTTYRSWSGQLERRTLVDDSVLSRYTARTRALDVPGVTLRIDFLPRFDCSPLVGVRVENAAASTVADALSDAPSGDDDVPIMAIDDETFEWTVVIDADDTVTTLWFDGDASQRERLRRRVDVGSRAVLTLSDATALSFSLLGSRRSTLEVERACRAHEPSPWSGADGGGQGGGGQGGGG